MRLSDVDIDVIDWDWFALDQEGWVGHFAKASHGPIPETVTSSREDLEFLVDYFRDEAPVVGNSSLTAIARAKHLQWTHLAGLSETYESFTDMANRGLVSYDYDDVKLRYYKVSIPQRALRAEELPEEIGRILRRTILSGISFMRQDIIPPTAISRT